jgi:hypothetical protein
MKVYRCLMVHNKKHKKGGWEKLAKHRDKSNTDFVGCKGRMEGYFGNDRYWFRINSVTLVTKGGVPHMQETIDQKY